MDTKIKVLIVDDSVVFRHAVENALADEENICIVGSVRNGAKAIEFLQTHNADIITLDVEMPEMDGIETLEKIQSLSRQGAWKKSPGIIMISAHTSHGTETTIRALQKGAFDFVEKPQGRSEAESVALLKKQLVPKILCFLSGHVPVHTLRTPPPFTQPLVSRLQKNAKTRSGIEAVVIGVSTGGPKALHEFLPDLCEKISIPILIVQHMPEMFTRSLAESLDKKCNFTVIEASEGDRVESNHVYIAPGGRHMSVRKKHTDTSVISISHGPPENGCRPSVDVLFRSAANVYAQNLIACILTGMGKDGAHSLRGIKRQGGYVIAQDEKSSVVWGMPGAAVETGFVDVVKPLNAISDTIAFTVKENATGQ